MASAVKVFSDDQPYALISEDFNTTEGLRDFMDFHFHISVDEEGFDDDGTQWSIEKGFSI